MSSLVDNLNKPIGLASDHAGFDAKSYIISVLQDMGLEYIDFGTKSTESTDYAFYARSHNDANVLSLPGRLLTNEEFYEILKMFLNTPFEGGRHQRRIDKIPCG